MLGHKIVSIPLDVVKSETNRKIKTVYAQLKICRVVGNDEDSGTLQLLAACEEGMFEARFSRSKLRKSKVKLDFSTEEWEEVTDCLFNVNLLEETPVPKGFENVVLVGRLTSSENYDDTGAIIGDDLSSKHPEFELSIRTNDILAVEYGLMSLKYQDMDELSEKDHSAMNLLTWISDMATQIGQVQKALFEKSRQLNVSEIIAAERKRAIEDMRSDYDVILRDVEDRFFQVLHSKKRRIAELEGDTTENFELLNLTYKERQKTNLKILNLEDIVIGEEAKRFGATGAKKRTKTKRRATGKNETDRAQISRKRKKFEPVEDKNEIRAVGELYASQDNVSANESDVEIDNSSNAKHQPAIKKESQNSSREPEIPIKVSTSDSKNSQDSESSHNPENPENSAGSESGSEHAAENTDYSDSGNDADLGHVSSAEDAASPATDDAGNETEYSD